jgi:hypothetical protein
MQAGKLKITPEQFRKQIAGAVPFFLLMLKNSAFQQKIAPALQQFLLNGGAMTLTAKPTRPVPFLQLIETANTSPEKLPDILAVELTTGQ